MTPIQCLNMKIGRWPQDWLKWLWVERAIKKYKKWEACIEYPHDKITEAYTEFYKSAAFDKGVRRCKTVKSRCWRCKRIED